MVKLNIRRVSSGGKFEMSENRERLDLFSTQGVCIEQAQRMVVSTGVIIEIPRGCVGIVFPNLKLAMTKGLDVLSRIIPSGYVEEVKLILLNTGYDDLVIKPGEKIAEVLVQKVESLESER